MKFSIRLCGIAVLSMSLMACTIGNGRICGPQTPRAYCDKEAYVKLLHPKGYGEYFVKPGMTKESWRQDWVACGGMKDGGYSVGEWQPGDIDDFATSRRTVKKLDACMQSNGYEYRYEP
jgi:hypothetical protein